MYVIYAYVICMLYLWGAHRSQKRGLGPLELQLQIDGCELPNVDDGT